MKQLKRWIKNNKNAAIYLSIMIGYTLIMLAVLAVGKQGKQGCSSGSLSSMMVDEEVTTNGGEQ